MFECTSIFHIYKKRSFAAPPSIILSVILLPLLRR
nr:MAG TPA: hypothetical protein [Caudoviricetes sp.]